MYHATGDALGLIPAGTYSEAQQCHRVRAGLALLEELGDLIQGEEGQLNRS